MSEITLTLEVFEWRGQQRYRCPLCSFDSHLEIEVVKHWKNIHKEPDDTPPMPLLFDSNGAEVKREIYVPDTVHNFSTGNTCSTDDPA